MARKNSLISVGDAATKFLQKRGLIYKQFNSAERRKKNRLQYGKILNENAKSLQGQ